MKKEQIIKHIQDAIIRGQYKQGQRLVERQLCEELGEKRGRVREALQQMGQEGFITAVPYKGSFVKKLTQKDISQIYDILGVLEGLSMRVATPTLADKEINLLETLVCDIENDQNEPGKIYRSNIKLHRHMAALGRNDWLISFTINLRRQAHRMSLENFYLPGQIEATISEHRAILNAIKEKSPVQVENLIREHYVNSRDRLIRSLNMSI